MIIRKAELSDLSSLVELAVQLFPAHTRHELTAEMEDMLCDSNAAVFLAFEEETPSGFAQCSLRHDYVEGTHSSPVGYLEGVFVVREHRNRNVARHLLLVCEDWARDQGCTEFASDCEFDNADSVNFHLHSGFTEVNRLVCFAKKLL